MLENIMMHFPLEDLEEASVNGDGYCIDCGAFVENVEPDAREYECEECGKKSVFGAEEILIMGLVS